MKIFLYLKNYLFICIALFLFLINPARATMLDSFEYIDKNDILDFQEVKPDLKSTIPVIKYFYKSDYTALPELIENKNELYQEDINLRTTFTQTFKLENSKKIINKIFSEPRFLNENGKWYLIKTGITTPELFNKKISDKSVFNFIKSASAETSYSTTCNGWAGRYGTGVSWATQRSANGNYNDNSPSLAYTDGNTGSYTSNYRVLFHFDTSFLANDAVVSSCSLNFTTSGTNKGNGFPDNLGDLILIENTSSGCPLANAQYNEYNFDNLGELERSSVNFDGITPNPIPCNADGKAFINLSGITKFGITTRADLSDTDPALITESGFNYANSGDYQPFLLIEIEEGEPPVETPAYFSGTGYLEYIDNFTIQIIEFVNMIILTIWFLYISTQYVAKIFRSIFNLDLKKRKYE